MLCMQSLLSFEFLRNPYLTYMARMSDENGEVKLYNDNGMASRMYFTTWYLAPLP